MFILSALAVFLKVNWDSEAECFESFAREMSYFYCVKKSLFTKSGPEEEKEQVVSDTVK